MDTRWVAAAALLGALACSDATAPVQCDVSGELLGAPAFDLVGALRAAGATVEDRGERLELRASGPPTRVAAVEGREVLFWEYCHGGDAAAALRAYGIGVGAASPPRIRLAPEEHLFTMAQVVALFSGDDAAVLAFLTQVMGPELRPPPS